MEWKVMFLVMIFVFFGVDFLSMDSRGWALVDGLAWKQIRSQSKALANKALANKFPKQGPQTR